MPTPESSKPFKEYSGRMIEIADDGMFLVNLGTEEAPAWGRFESFKLAVAGIEAASGTERKAQARSIRLAALTASGVPVTITGIDLRDGSLKLVPEPKKGSESSSDLWPDMPELRLALVEHARLMKWSAGIRDVIHPMMIERRFGSYGRVASAEALETILGRLDQAWKKATEAAATFKFPEA